MDSSDVASELHDEVMMEVAVAMADIEGSAVSGDVADLCVDRVSEEEFAFARPSDNDHDEDHTCNFSHFYNDQSKVETRNKLSYIILLLADLENRDLSVKNEELFVTLEEFVLATYPFSDFLNTKGWKSKLLAGKKLIVGEIFRRNPSERPNKNNKSVKKLMMMMNKYPLSDDDVKFVKDEGDRFSLLLQAQLTSEENEGGNRQWDTD